MKYSNHTSQFFSNRQDLCHAPKQSSGFALVATVSMMVLLTLIALGMLSLATLEQRSSGGGDADDAMRTAKANARMALMIALGDLQKAAGPDQRVTATASIMGSLENGYTNPLAVVPMPAPANGKAHWVGVWDTSNYSPANPDNKSFLRWLVSSPNPDDVDALGDVTSAAAADDVVIFEGADSASTVKVPKVEVATTSDNSSYYAYWVEDEGVKADLAWDEIPYPNPLNYPGLADDPNYLYDLKRAQARRLSATPGPDHGVFGGPFTTGVNYPLEESSNSWLEKLVKAFSPADMPLVMNDDSDHSSWLQENRHDMTVGSRGVMADVKKGGLRRDLSLAFEMDGADLPSEER